MPQSNSHAIDVLADHYQFYVADEASHGAWVAAGHEDEPAGWSHDAVHVHRIGSQKHSISVGTARDDRVRVQLDFAQSPPPQHAAAEHVVEADIEVETDTISVYGPADDPGTELRFPLSPHRYRVRVSYLPSEPHPAHDRDSPGDHHLHLIEMWPTTVTSDLRVLVQGPSTWDG